MNENWMILFKISLVFFMAGNLLEMGLVMAIRNQGVAIAPIFSLSVIDPRAMIMIILGIPIIIVTALLATRWFSRYVPSGETGQ
jgi:hypothetical protein